MKKKNKKLLLIFRVLVTIGIFFALFKLVPYNEVIRLFKQSQRVYLLSAIVMFFIVLFLGIVRWKFILNSLGVPVKLSETSGAFFSGLFFNLFFPSFVAGDIFRGFSISRQYGERNKVASSVLMDRFSGAVALAGVALASFLRGWNLIPRAQVLPALLSLSGIICGGALVIFSRRFFTFWLKVFKDTSALKVKLISFHDQLYFFRQNPLIFVKTMGFSVIIQILVPIGFFLSAKAFSSDAGIIYFLILVPIIMAIALIPITIAGAGTREAAAVYFFALVGIDKSIGLGISLVNLVFMVLAGVLGGLYYVSVYHRRL